MSEPHSSQAEPAYAYCVRRLAAAARTEHDLRTKLAERGYDPQVIDDTLARLRRSGYVDDGEFARAWVSSRGRTRGYAASRLRLELRERGVDAPLIEQAIAENDDPQAEQQRALALLERKVPDVLPAERADRDRLRRRLVGVLARRGYPPARALELVDQALAGSGESS